MKSALIIRHVPYEGVAGYRQPIEEAGYTVDRIDVCDPAFPALDLREPDLLIMMGGPMGIYDQIEHPWIRCQMRRLALRLAADRPTLGVCFGAQMIAAALGAEVYRGHAKEVGFHPVQVHVADSPCATWPACRCCTGMAIPSPCRPRPNCLPPAMSIRTRPSGAGAICWRCNSMPKWAKTPALTPGSNSRPKMLRKRATAKPRCAMRMTPMALAPYRPAGR
jgi:hypothetical protein